MLVYSDQEMHINPTSFLGHLLKTFSAADVSATEPNRNLLIEAGMLESGLCDELFADEDSICHVSQELRRLSISIGRMYYRSLKGVHSKPLEVPQILTALMRNSIPERMTIKTPEGYAYYGLYPETYIKAAEKFSYDFNTGSAVCIGIRSIGTSLSALIAATLQKCGWQIESFTIRPRGHPFAKTTKLSSKLKKKILEWKNSKFLIIDEGPELSGSTMTCVAKELVNIGIKKNDIFFFPASNKPPHTFFSEDAERIWYEHPKYICSFESLFEKGQELVFFPDMISVNLSAGKWRDLFYDGTRDFPAVNPNHEKRKYLLRNDNRVFLAKFEGFKLFSKEKFRIAQELAALNFSPAIESCQNGFFIFQFVPGKPLDAKEVNHSLIDQLAKYVSVRKQIAPSKNHSDLDLLFDMMIVNVDEGLGPQWREKLQKCHWAHDELSREGTCAVDGKMLPHKWIKTQNGFLKTDSLDHHCDQFLPQCQDIAWDVAGICTEFKLSDDARLSFLSKYKTYSHDRTIEKRLPFYWIAYLAFRLGYVSLSMKTLRNTPEERRFAALRNYYSEELQKQINLSKMQ
jgi:hypothetical protein